MYKQHATTLHTVALHALIPCASRCRAESPIRPDSNPMPDGEVTVPNRSCLCGEKKCLCARRLAEFGSDIIIELESAGGVKRFL